jgi:hypothetical protein
MQRTARPDRVVRWLDPEGLEIKANPLAPFMFRLEIQKVSEMGGILRVIGV